MGGYVVGTEPVPAATLLQQLQAQGFELAVRGDRLRIRPADRVTPELRDTLAARKHELLAALATPPVVTLRPAPGFPHGLSVPVAALQLLWSLEAREFAIRLLPSRDVDIQPAQALTARDHADLQRWHRHVAAIVTYVDALDREPVS